MKSSSVDTKRVMVRNQLVSAFRRENLSRDDDSAGAEETKAPADGAEDPGLIELPANEEPVFVVEEVGLDDPSVLCIRQKDAGFGDTPTTIDILAACNTADRIIRILKSLHPFSRSLFPPERIIR